MQAVLGQLRDWSLASVERVVSVVDLWHLTVCATPATAELLGRLAGCSQAKVNFLHTAGCLLEGWQQG